MDDYISGMKLVSVAGRTHIRKDYVRKCVESWARLAGTDGPYRLISDGLDPEGREIATDLGFVIEDDNPEAVSEAVSSRPALAILRKRLPTWRHVIDSLILYQQASRIVLADTDILIQQEIGFESTVPDFSFNCDDIPGYRGSAILPFTERMVPTINPGFMLLNPRAVDMDFLEYIARKYFVRCKNYWWTRQAALSVLVAQTESRGLFSGEDVRVISGNLKRTPEEIIGNRWKLLGNSAGQENEEIIRKSMDGAAVLHLAGRGKNWIELAEGLAPKSNSGRRTVRVEPAPLASGRERLLICLRMFFLQVGRKRRVPRVAI